MAIVLWIAAVIVAANAVLGAWLLIRFRGEERRAADGRQRRQPHAGQV